MYDVIIIGSGIAGMTAAIYTTRRELKTLILTTDIGGQMSKNPEIGNWPGEELINGTELSTKMKSQVEKLGAEVKYEMASKIEKKDKIFQVTTMASVHQAKTVILAFGKVPRRLNIPGEQELVGRGVSYCVTCDGPFFKGKTVIITGGGNSALDAANLMSKIASKVYLVHRGDKFRGDEYLINKVHEDNNVEIIMNANLVKINGEKKVESAELDNGKTISSDAVFIEIGYIVNDNLINGLVDLDEKGQVITNASQMTSVPGLFAAGDLTDALYQQLVIAAGEGACAGLSAYHYIESKAQD